MMLKEEILLDMFYLPKWFAFYTQQSKKKCEVTLEKIFHDFYFNKD